MQHQRCLCLVLAGIGWLYGPLAAGAQHRDALAPRRAYVHIPFESDVDQLLQTRDLDALKEILERFPKDLGSFKLTQGDWDKLGLDRPGRFEQIQKLLKDLAIEPEKRSAIDSALEKKNNKTDGRPGKNDSASSTAPTPPGKLPSLPPEAALMPPEAPSGEDLLARWTRDLLKDKDRWEWEKIARESPALQKGLDDLQKLLEHGAEARRGVLSGELARWAAELRPTSGRMLDLPDLSWARPGSLSLPSLPRLNLQVPRLGIGGVPHVAVDLPRLGSPAGSGRAFGHGFLWVAVLGLAGLVFWQVTRQWSGIRSRRAGAAWQPGPWPVNPANVATRAELIKAFEYLSLLRLGPDARSWNHRAIAASLGKDGEDGRSRLAAEELASLYERARYAPATDSLPAEALASARRDLCLLAGVASA